MSYLSKIMREQREAAREQTPEAQYRQALEVLQTHVGEHVQHRLDTLAELAKYAPVEPPAAVLSRPSIPACFRRIT